MKLSFCHEEAISSLTPSFISKRKISKTKLNKGTVVKQSEPKQFPERIQLPFGK